jgi:hypothetical protein
MTAKLICSMPELLAAIRARRDALNISHETIDDLAGLPAGYTSKLLSPDPIRGIGYMSLGAVLGALGMALIAVEDSAAVTRVHEKWVPRKRPQRKAPELAPNRGCVEGPPTTSQCIATICRSRQ